MFLYHRVLPFNLHTKQLQAANWQKVIEKYLLLFLVSLQNHRKSSKFLSVAFIQLCFFFMGYCSNKISTFLCCKFTYTAFSCTYQNIKQVCCDGLTWRKIRFFSAILHGAPKIRKYVVVYDLTNILRDIWRCV